MVFVNIKDVVALIVLIFALAVCGTIIMVDRIAFALKKRRQKHDKEERR